MVVGARWAHQKLPFVWFTKLWSEREKISSALMSLFLLQHLDGRIRNRHKQRKNMDPSCLVSIVEAAAGGVMV